MQRLNIACYGNYCQKNIQTSLMFHSLYVLCLSAKIGCARRKTFKQV